MINLRAVTLSYPNRVTALRSVSLTLHRNQITILLGPSGAGKSSLLRCLNGLATPTNGRIEVEGLGDFSDPGNLQRHRCSTGMVFQLHHLIGRLTALDNVLQGRLGYHSAWRTFFPLPRSEVRFALECLDRVGLATKALIRSDQLSGGERQRVGIARALCQKPKLLLADEPVASLDPANGEMVMTLLHRICREDGLTAVVSLHQTELALRFADRIVGLAEGRIAFDGAPEAFGPEAHMDVYGSPRLRRPEDEDTLAVDCMRKEEIP